MDHLTTQQRGVSSESSEMQQQLLIITNPPYGERIEERANLPALYTEIGRRFRA